MVTQIDRKQSSDQLAITKAAAWAWYERGSWFGHNSILEADCRRTADYTPRPSRYKLEVIKKAESCNNNNNNNHNNNNHPLLGTDKKVDESLLDMYEMKRLILRDQDSYVESSRLEHHLKLVNDSDHVSQGTKSKRKGKGKVKNKKRNMFSMGHRIMCGSRSNDVVEHANSLVGGKHPQKRDVRMDGIVNIRRPLIHG